MDIFFQVAGFAVIAIIVIAVAAPLLTRKDFSPERMERRRRRQRG